MANVQVKDILDVVDTLKDQRADLYQSIRSLESNGGLHKQAIVALYREVDRIGKKIDEILTYQFSDSNEGGFIARYGKLAEVDKEEK